MLFKKHAAFLHMHGKGVYHYSALKLHKNTNAHTVFCMQPIQFHSPELLI